MTAEEYNALSPELQTAVDAVSRIVYDAYFALLRAGWHPGMTIEESRALRLANDAREREERKAS